jgi:diphosphomevalonate decarboxylase
VAHELCGAHAQSRANIALAKYWGKANVTRNLPAVPSISLTLDALVTETEVSFDSRLRQDCFVLDGNLVSPNQRRRVVELLDRVRSRAGIDHKARVSSRNHFPTAAGLASSASGFAALAAAAARAAGLELDRSKVSALARRSSASAARSVFGGFVELPAGRPGDDALAAETIAPETHWDVRLVLALTAIGPKAVSSTEAMELSRATSPYYEAWVEAAPRWSEQIKRAVACRDLEALGEAMERSTLAFHCCAITSQPSTLYWGPGTIAALRAVRELRAQGVPVWSTMDAGPHVKALCEVDDAWRVRCALESTTGVIETLVAAPGAGVSLSP